MSTDPSHGPPAGDDDLAARVGDATRRLELEDPDRGLPLADRVINRAVEILGVGLLGRHPRDHLRQRRSPATR